MKNGILLITVHSDSLGGRNLNLYSCNVVRPRSKAAPLFSSLFEENTQLQTQRDYVPVREIATIEVVPFLFAVVIVIVTSVGTAAAVATTVTAATTVTTVPTGAATPGETAATGSTTGVPVPAGDVMHVIHQSSQS